MSEEAANRTERRGIVKGLCAPVDSDIPMMMKVDNRITPIMM